MRRIRNLGLAAVMALTLSVVAGPASASAAGKIAVAGGGSTDVEGVRTGVLTLIRPGGGGVECNQYGNFKGTVNHHDESLAPDTLSDMECVDNVQWGEETTYMNGCTFIFTPGPEGTGKGTAEVGPPGCGAMIFTFLGCEKAIAPQGGIDATYTNTAWGTFEIDLHDAITYTPISGSPAICGTIGTPKTATLDASWKVFGNAELFLIRDLGLSVSGAQFKAEAYPAAVSGGQDPTDVQTLTFAANRRFECDEVDATGQLSSASATLGLGAEYAGCVLQWLGDTYPASVDANSCGYWIGASGSLSVSCAKEGDTIEVEYYVSAKAQAEGVPLCRYEIPAQVASGSLGLTNFGIGVLSGVEVDFNQASLNYTRTLGTLGNCSAKSNTAAYDGASLLTATS